MSGFVYVIREANGPCKVGKTCVCPTKRLSQMQTGNPRKLTLVWFLETEWSSAIERTAHSYLSRGAKRVGGEWFEVEPETAREAIQQAAAYVAKANEGKRRLVVWTDVLDAAGVM
jgi:hypothetical protein